MPFLPKSKRVQFLLAVGVGQFLMGLSYVTTPTKSRSQGFAWIPLDIGPDEGRDGADEPIDLRMYVDHEGRAMSETWIYQVFPSQLRALLAARA